jgi:hypothetical protein
MTREMEQSWTQVTGVQLRVLLTFTSLTCSIVRHHVETRSLVPGCEFYLFKNVVLRVCIVFF